MTQFFKKKKQTVEKHWEKKRFPFKVDLKKKPKNWQQHNFTFISNGPDMFEEAIWMQHQDDLQSE